MSIIKHALGEDCEILCGYEAGCPGYSLYHELTAKGIKCVIMAPGTTESAPVNKIKTDKRNAKKLAGCLATGGYKKENAESGFPHSHSSATTTLRGRDDLI